MELFAKLVKIQTIKLLKQKLINLHDVAMNAMKLSLLKNFMILDLKVSMELSVEHAKVPIMPLYEEEIMPIGQTDINVNTDYI